MKGQGPTGAACETNELIIGADRVLNILRSRAESTRKDKDHVSVSSLEVEERFCVRGRTLSVISRPPGCI